MRPLPLPSRAVADRGGAEVLDGCAVSGLRRVPEGLAADDDAWEAEEGRGAEG